MSTDGVVYLGQGYLDIKCDMNIDVTSATSKSIKYVKPSGVTGTWTDVTVEGTGILVKELADADIDVVGKWTFQPFAVIDGRTAKGLIQSQTFKQPL